MNKEIEILSPAGSYDSLKAAILAGADAVYVGGCKFGARAFANNLTQQELLEAIDYVHLHQRKIFLTVNTLLKEHEITEELYDYLKPLYNQGLDAVIVQDVGVIAFVKRYFPGLDIHASTQMTITNVLGAKFLEGKGVTRVVTSRELKLHEIKEIAKETTLEVESFVHGALCYCYSGQCLFSSLIGGRSGNRGQCAQPCRLPYEIKGKKGKSYLLSLKDICTLEFIPELIEHGIYSLKIEGRMKKPEYVAAVTSMYRKYVDLYFEVGASKYKVDKKDKELLMDLYNRGGFHEGYYHTQNGPEMVSFKRPNHAGIKAIKVTTIRGNQLQGISLTDLHKGDIIELSGKQENYTLGEEIRKGQPVRFRVKKQTGIETVLYRTRNESLIQELHKEYVNHKIQEKINGNLTIVKDEPVTLTLWNRDKKVCVVGEVPELAVNQPMDQKRVETQIRKTGNTDFVFHELKVDIDDGVFLQMQKLNELRRNGLDTLAKAICDSYRRDSNFPYEVSMDELQNKERQHLCMFNVSVESKEQFYIVNQWEEISAIYVDCNMITKSYQNKDIKLLVDAGHKKHKKMYFAFPHVVRKETRDHIEKHYKTWLEQGFDGALIRNYETYEFLKEHQYSGEIILDSNMYYLNHYCTEFWKEEDIEYHTASLELNYRELKKSNLDNTELVVYGYYPVMVSAQCIQKNTFKCTHVQGNLLLKDRCNKEFVVKNCCDYCYNVIYNTAPVVLLDQQDEISQLGARSLRLQFSIEDASQTQQVLEAYVDTFFNNQSRVLDIEFTRGHFKRGIK
ncbi:DUF3656 domain-containing U32 family peptidase [Lachnospiraceae bacterium LCP25S3_G4]